MSGGARPLARSMRLPGVLFLTLSAATPASSVFVIVPDVLRGAGTGALWAMAGAAVVAACVAQVYAELASAFPYSGGEYAMTARVLGAPAGFAVLAVNTLNLLLAVAVLSLGVAEQLAAVWPGLPAVPVALGCVALAAACAVLDVRANAAVTGAFLLVELLALAAVAALGLLQPERGLGELLLHPVRAEGGALAPVGAAAVALTVAVALFGYDGYGSAAYLAEELQDPRRRVARAVTWSLALVVGFELLPLAAVLAGAPDLRAVLDGGFGPFVAARAGPAAARALALAVALAVFNAVLALMVLSARQLYGAARDGAWPRAASALLARVHPRLGSPWAATLAAGVAAAGLCLVPLRLLLVVTGVGLTAIYAVLCVVLLAGRRTGATAAATHRAPLHPWLPGLTLLALLLVLGHEGLSDGEGRAGFAVTLGVMAAGVAWGATAARAGRWRPTGPPDEA